MNRLTNSQSFNPGGLLRIEFSEKVSTRTLQVLHHEGLTDTVPEEIRSVIEAAGGERISAVYQLSEEETAEDRYGFAREFQLSLRSDASEARAIEILSRSPLITTVRAIEFLRY